MSRRVERVNELLRSEISRLLSLQTKDPRLNCVISITRVVTARDLRVAQVFISVMGNPETKQNALEGMRSAAAFLRRELRPRVSLRYTPFLKFSLDDSMEDAEHILGIMDQIRDDQIGGTSSSDGARYVGPLTFPTNSN